MDFYRISFNNHNFTILARFGKSAAGFNLIHKRKLKLDLRTGNYFGCYVKRMSFSRKCFSGEVVEGNKSIFQSVCVNGNGSKIKNEFGKYSYSYEETIAALNGLQSNSALLAASARTLDIAKQNLVYTPKLLECVGIQEGHLLKLNAIHVAGTKGKGSTCAVTECILRTCGYKTGFYSSPHLINVTERIRINGDPLEKNVFIHYFWDTYNKIIDFVGSSKMPPYFHFLTILAFRIFSEENVDVAIIETGVGGEYDTTNILKLPAVVGITSIGLDHTSILGDTLEKIAWQKAGILKNGVSAFTVPQEPEVLRIFLERSKDKNCKIELSPSLSKFQDIFGNKLVLGMPGKVQEVNASLALQLSYAWLRKVKSNDYKILVNSCSVEENKCMQNSIINYAKTFPVPEPFTKALLESKWLGRFQTVRKKSIVYFLDGAHTPESILLCCNWFLEASSQESKDLESPKDVYRVLIFNCTKGRKPEVMLSPLMNTAFDCAIFSPNHVTKEISSTSDQTNFSVDPDNEYQQCHRNCNVWNFLQKTMMEEKVYNDGGNSLMSYPPSSSLVFDCLTEAIDWLTQGRDTREDLQVSNSMASQLPKPCPKLLKAKQLQILVTGSLHLVGGVLKVLQSKYGQI